jgi:hypothetical protein
MWFGFRTRAKKGKGGVHKWKSDNCFYLYTRNPDTVMLAMTVMDENVLKDDVVLGSATVRLKDLMGPPAGATSERDWEGWIDLTSKPASKDRSGKAFSGAAAGGVFFGPAGETN